MTIPSSPPLSSSLHCSASSSSNLLGHSLLLDVRPLNGLEKIIKIKNNKVIWLVQGSEERV
jgi:hypothetical protein